MIKCNKCGKIETLESKCNLHHLVPKFMGGTDKEGRVYLCEKCHNILHNILPSIIWKFVVDKAGCIKAVKSFSLKYMEEN